MTPRDRGRADRSASASTSAAPSPTSSCSATTAPCARAKVLSTPDDYARGVVDGRRGAARRDAASAPDEVAGVVHASTVASNTILEGHGARTALVTTRGFRDVLEMRRLRIPVLYDIQYESPRAARPAPAAATRSPSASARAARCGASSTRRASRDGRRADRATTDVEAVAIALLHSYADDGARAPRRGDRPRGRRRRRLRDPLVGDPPRDPRVRAHEHGRRQRVRRPGRSRATSARSSARLRGGGDRRAARGDAVERRHADARDRAAQARAPGRVGPGGRRDGLRLPRPPHGPRAADLARHGRHDREGGDRRGRPARADERVRGRRRDQPLAASSSRAAATRSSSRSSTSPRSAPAAAASSRVDHARHRRRRPGQRRLGARARSATALGGVEPTLTDALLALGYLNATAARRRRDHARSGAASREALDRVVATPLGRSVEEAAHGILLLAVATMTRAVKAVTTYRGRDPRDFTLCAFGGNGPLTGVEIARALADAPGAHPSRARASSARSGSSSPTPSTRSCGR